MKIKVGIVAGLIGALVLFSASVFATGQSSMGDQQKKDQQALSQDPNTVKQVQQALSTRGYDPGTMDGKWSSKTESAVKDFQKSEGLQANGQLDQQTLASLGVSGAAAGGQQDMSGQQSGAGGQQGSMPDQQSDKMSGGQQGGSKY